MNEVTATATEATPAKASDGLIEVRVTAIRYAARDTHLYEFTRLDGKPLPAYEPGAHIDLHLPNGMIRQYSLINAEPDPATYTVGIKRDPASRGGSRYVHDDLRVGKTLKISAPRNNFALVESAKHVVLFAGGIGITPIWCMVQRLEQLGRSWTLYYAARSRSDMAFLQSLEAMAPAQFHFDDESRRQVPRRDVDHRRDAEGRPSLLLRADADAQGVRGGDHGLAARADPRRIFHAEAGGRTRRAASSSSSPARDRNSSSPKARASCRCCSMPASTSTIPASSASAAPASSG